MGDGASFAPSGTLSKIDALYSEKCVICQGTVDSQENRLQTVKPTSIIRIKEYSDFVKNEDLSHYLSQDVFHMQVKIHRCCQKTMNNALRTFRNKCSSKKVRKVTRDQTTSFDWKNMCFFCEELCVIDKKHPSRNLVQEVTTLPFRDKLLQLCRDRNDDTWGLQVKSLLLNSYDLVAAEGRYHKNCYDKFRKMQPEQQPTIVKSPGGRNVDQTKVAQFEELCEWMESE